MERLQLSAIVAATLLVGAAVGAGAMVIADTSPATASTGDESTPEPQQPTTDDNSTDDGPRSAGEGVGLVQFDSESDFASYVNVGQNRGTAAVSRQFQTTADQAVRMEASGDSAQAAPDASGGGSDTPRASSTNVQVTGIDEPDYLKTTGSTTYYSPTPRRYFLDRRIEPEPVVEDDVAVSDHDDEQVRPRQRQTHVFDTSDPARPDEIAGLNATGKLLQTENRLVVFADRRLVGYDISDPENPTETWSRALNGTVEAARLLNGTVYIVTRTSVSTGTSCDIEPVGGAAIDCTDIYRPRGQINADATYTAVMLEPDDGDIEDTVTVVGTADTSAVYLSANGLYLTYTERVPQGEVRMDALLSDRTDTPAWVDQRLRDLRSYNLSARAMELETAATLETWLNGLDAAERETVTENLRSAIETYVRDNRREFVTSGVVRIGVGDGLSVDAVGEVPGEPLNQFALDEHDGTLRVSTTIPRQYGTDSTNDLYTLDAESLERQGAVKGMSDDQRVYAVRYVGDTGYVVTYRQVDPLHVVDLSDPTAPEEVGTLELPGYSSYLHPINDTHVLGIGKEDGNVKSVLFDVSDPTDPTIADTYFPNAGWSAIADSHHAFLLDRRHEVFFLPGSESGFVVDYTDGLREVAEIDIEGQPQRAAYIGDYLYVFSDQSLTVVDESDWSTETERSLW